MFLCLYALFWVACSEQKSDTSEGDTTEQRIDDQGCTYKDYIGTCTYETGGFFTYTGIVEGTEVSFEGNPYTLGPADNEPAAGSSVECTLSYMTTGTCTPCLIDIGACGSEAFSGMP